MAIVKMKKITIAASKSDRERVLKTLQNNGVVEISQSTDELLDNERISLAEVDADIRQTEKALKILSQYSDKSFKNDKELSNSVELREKVINISADRQKMIDEINRIDFQILSLSPYTSLDISLDLKKEGDVTFKIGVVNRAIDDNELKGLCDFAQFEIINKTDDKTYLFVAFLGDISEQLIKLGFIEEKYQSEKTPTEEIKYLENRKVSLKQQIVTLENNLREYSKRENELSVLPLLSKREMLEARSKIGLTDSTFIIEGYIPSKYVRSIKKILNFAYVVTEDAPSDAPVAFSNNIFSSPVEEVTGTYSMPGINDIDPNSIMSFFYYLFFGMMFSDAGYGLLLVLVCGYLGFFKKIKSSKMFQMFFFCGISTTFWGFMYGSFFGNSIQTISEKFFGHALTLKPLWIDPTTEPLKLLILSIALGFIQIMVGLSIRFYMDARRGKLLDAIFDTGSWILVLLGICVYVIGIVYSPIKNIGLIIALIGVAILIATQGRHNKGILGKIFGGIISLYDITSYVSDILSYSRLMALGLTTGVIANVINILGSMGGKSFVGIVMYIVVFIVGHLINFAINMLGAYVHTNRLQYVEFFSKFYEGGGKQFKPFGKYKLR